MGVGVGCRLLSLCPRCLKGGVPSAMMADYCCLLKQHGLVLESFLPPGVLVVFDACWHS